MILLLLAACLTEELIYNDVSFTPEELDRLAELTPPPPPRDDPTNAYADDPAAAKLGQFLFFDARLSASGTVSCATCHDPERAFTDDLQLAEGEGTTARRAPQIRTSAWNRWFFWDGRADSAWAQALGPLESPDEHGSSRLEIAHLLDEDPDLREAYEGVFGELPDFGDLERYPARGRPVPGDPDHPDQLAWDAVDPLGQTQVNTAFANLGKAIAAYERLLLPGPAPFDELAAALIEGDVEAQGAFLPSAARGIKFFLGDASCALCHAGPTFSNQEFHNIGLGHRPGLVEDDPGRFEGVALVIEAEFNGASPYSDDRDFGKEKLRYLEQKPELIGAFKTPSLRNALPQRALMHGGHFYSPDPGTGALDQVIQHYNAPAEIPDVGVAEDTLQPLNMTEDEKEYARILVESMTVDDLDASLLSAPETPY